MADPALATVTDLTNLVGAVDGTVAAAALDAASALVRSYCRQYISEASTTETFAAAGDRTLLLSETPVTAVGSVTVDGVALDAADYWVSAHGELQLTSGVWGGAVRSVVAVAYTHGYATIPDKVRDATVMLAARLVDNPTGSVNREQIGSYSVGYAASSGELIEGERVLLAEFRV